jgi:hypothetical protein
LRPKKINGSQASNTQVFASFSGHIVPYCI